GLGAEVTLAEYGDYECPYSRRAYRSVQLIEQELGPRLLFVFRHFPLTGIHPHAQLAAEAAEEAAAQGRFWPMHDLLYHRQRALAAAELRRYAGEVGLALSRFDAALADGRHRDRIEEDILSGVAGGVDGTPALFINGARCRGPYDAGVLGPLLARAAGL